MRLDKFLADSKLGTRSQVKEYIKKGNICVNNDIVKKPEFKIDENNDIVTCFGKKVIYSRYRYYMLHKPSGVITATTDNKDKTVMDLFSGENISGLFPVGRLDKDTEGLLIITDDGELSHNLLSPKKHIPKTYYVEYSGIISENGIKILETGVDIGDDKKTLPAQVQIIEKSEVSGSMELTITEGRFHQVKRMIKAVGGEVIYLKRIAMGALKLDNTLKKGCYRQLTDEELAMLKVVPKKS